MTRFLICSNSKCHFILDLRLSGRSIDGLPIGIRTCPSCDGSWSTTCPSCRQALEVKFVAGRPSRVCCDSKRRAAEQRSDRPPAMAAQAGA